MIKLEVGNSVSRITGLNQKQFDALRKLMSYRVDPQATYFSGDHRGGLRYLLGKRGDFPTGLLYIANRWLSEQPEKCEVVDQRIKPTLKINFPLNTGLEPYVEQVQAATACATHKRGIVCAPTGVGKSLMIALTVWRIGVKTLIVVPSLELKRQLTLSLMHMFGDSRVGGLGYPIAVENVAALDPSLDIKQRHGYDMVIIDEFHHSGASTYRALNKRAWRGVYYKLGFTATPFRSQDHEKLLLESVLSKVIYRVTYKQAVEKGYIVPIEAYYFELPKQRVNGTTWPQVYKQLVTDNPYRNVLIMQLMDTLHSERKSTLCLVKEIAHGKRLCTNTGVAFVKGENDDNRERILEFALGERTNLIATTGVMGEGVDTKACEYVVIAGLGKSKNAFMQQCGRGVRRWKDKDSCKVILFHDKSHKFTHKHFLAQVKYLRDEYGVIPVKLNSNES